MHRFTAAVIGLGRIGQEFDFDVRRDRRVLTHASAFWHHPKFELVAGVDRDAAARGRFAKKFHRPAYASLKAMYKDLPRLDVVAIAVPTLLHRLVFEEVLRCRPRAIVCEKPLAATVADGKRMVVAAQAQRCALLVNYMRRFEPATVRARELVRDQQLGEVFKGTAWYSKGLLNAGSHLIDLLQFWLGEVTTVNVLARGKHWSPGRRPRMGDGDPEPDVQLIFKRALVYLLAAREECFTYMAIELLGTRGKLRYAERGEVVEIRRAVSDSVFRGYTILERKGKLLRSDMPRYQWHVADHLYRHLTRGTPLNSDGASALKTLAVVENIVKFRDTAKRL